MAVQAKVKRQGTNINIEINNKSETNKNSKNRYIPQLQTNIDDQEPPSQASIQNIIPYMNKAPSLPMYNSGNIGIRSRYGNMAPQGSTNLPQGYHLGNDINQPAIPSEYDFLDAGNEEENLFYILTCQKKDLIALNCLKKILTRWRPEQIQTFLNLSSYLQKRNLMILAKFIR